MQEIRPLLRCMLAGFGYGAGSFALVLAASLLLPG
jgi:hypothetical protein